MDQEILDRQKWWLHWFFLVEHIQSNKKMFLIPHNAIRTPLLEYQLEV
jgi:hypothetical protein